jgi:hypothetical protein
MLFYNGGKLVEARASIGQDTPKRTHCAERFTVAICGEEPY